MAGDERPIAWRERKKTLLRDAIVRNALELFAERGYDAVSVDEIAEASSCSRSTFHRYFGTKEDLLFPDADRYLRTFSEEIDGAAGADPWLEATRAAQRGLFGFATALDPDLRASFGRIWVEVGATRRRYQEIVVEWETVLVRHFERALGEQSTVGLESQLLASLVTSALRAALVHSVASGDDIEATAARAFELIESSPLIARLRPVTQPAS